MSQPSHAPVLSYASIIRIIFVLLILAFLYIIREVVALVFVAVVLSAALDPFVDYFQKHKIPRSVSILVIYLIVFAVFSLVIVLLVPPVSEQIGQLAKSLPDFYERVLVGLHSGDTNTSLPDALGSISDALTQTTKGVFSTLTGIFGGFFSFLSVLVMVFYLVVEEHGLKYFIRFITPDSYRSYVMNLVDRIQDKMGYWVRGQLTLMLIIAIMTYLALTILGVKYALLLALIAGLTEIIPFVGPIIGAIPAIFIAFSDSVFKAVLVAIIYIVIQQLENHILVPKVMQKAIGLNPVIVIIAILIGSQLGGVIGALLAVPVAAMIEVFLSDILAKKSITPTKE